MAEKQSILIDSKATSELLVLPAEDITLEQQASNAESYLSTRPETLTPLDEMEPFSTGVLTLIKNMREGR